MKVCDNLPKTEQRLQKRKLHCGSANNGWWIVGGKLFAFVANFIRDISIDDHSHFASFSKNHLWSILIVP